MSLACGGKGPCCHVGYPHRHCEHCDVVIATYPYYHWHQPYWGYQTGYLNSQTFGLQQPHNNAQSGQDILSQLAALGEGTQHQH